jgi:hypothetical protein
MKPDRPIHRQKVTPKKTMKSLSETRVLRMILRGRAKIWDLELDFLEKHLALIDVQLGRLAVEGRASGDADTFEIFDDINSLVGLGFVDCQRYITATCGWLKIPKDVALAAGPKHPTGMTIIQIIDHAANYWKHHGEWSEKKTSPEQQRTETAMKAIRALDSDYPMITALGEVTVGNRFTDTLPDLAWWHHDLRAPCTSSIAAAGGRTIRDCVNREPFEVADKGVSGGVKSKFLSASF